MEGESLRFWSEKGQGLLTVGEWGGREGAGPGWCYHPEGLRLARPHAPQILGLVVLGVFSPVISACPRQNHLQSLLERQLPEPLPR